MYERFNSRFVKKNKGIYSGVCIIEIAEQWITEYTTAKAELLFGFNEDDSDVHT